VPLPASLQPDLPFKILKRLNSLTARQLVTYAQVPRLTAEKAASWVNDQGQWADSILDLDVKEVFADADRLRYFTEFVSDERERHSPDVWSAAAKPLLQLVRKAIALLGLAGLRQYTNDIRALVALIPERFAVPIPTMGVERQRHVDSFIEGLSALDADRLLLPDTFVFRAVSMNVSFSLSQPVHPNRALDQVRSPGGLGTTALLPTQRDDGMPCGGSYIRNYSVLYRTRTRFMTGAKRSAWP
jgi:hypothetical protein